ncbi:peptidase inhibitor clitocypin-domain-containing protein [Infundibulicybe gibba]|nr:peptidase inhibitor clitocypin-domain-containing protein [Infundibulicybe gibba]
MTLKDGVYMIKATPDPGPLITAAQRPPWSEFQHWKVTQVGPDAYTLKPAWNTIHPGSYGFSWRDPLEENSPVFLNRDPKEFNLRRVPATGAEELYRIDPIVNRIGVEICVGTSEHGGPDIGPPLVEFKIFPINTQPHERPVWRFIPSEN